MITQETPTIKAVEKSANKASRIYADANATAPLLEGAYQQICAVLLRHGNASSIHSEGRKARAEIERARDAVAMLVGARAKNVIFTSGGTEANALALSSSLRRGKGAFATRLITSAVEHPSILAGGGYAFSHITHLPVDAHGLVDPAYLRAALETIAAEQRGKPQEPTNEPATETESILVSIQAANNETGVLQDISALARIAKEAGALFHTDAVQLIGKARLDFSMDEIDLISLSAHKIGGPQGAGALVFASEAVRIAIPLLRGGGQERGQRAGTENIAAITGFGVAANLVQARGVFSSQLRDAFEAGLKARFPQAIIFGEGAARLANTSCFALLNLTAERALIALDLMGVALSSGSACSSGKVARSHVLKAMGVADNLAACALRLSLHPENTAHDIEEILNRLQKISA